MTAAVREGLAGTVDRAPHKSVVSRAQWRLQGARLLLLAALLLAWHLMSVYLVDPFWISSPTAVLDRLSGWIFSGTLYGALVATVYATIVGFVLGGIAGAALGFVLGRSERLARLLDPFIAAIYALPKVALAPLFILWFGLGITSKIMLSAVLVLFLVFYNTFAGVRSVDRDLVNTLRLFGGSRIQVLSLVVIPSASRWVFAGFRIAAPYALAGAVVGEMIASNQGLGYLLRAASGNFDTAGTFASLLVIMLIASLINVTISAAERRATRWERQTVGSL